MNKKLLLFLSFLCFGTINAQTPSKKTNSTVSSITSPIQNNKSTLVRNSEFLPTPGIVKSQNFISSELPTTQSKIDVVQMIQQKKATTNKNTATSNNNIVPTNLCISGDTTPYSYSGVYFNTGYLLGEKINVATGGFLQNLSLLGNGTNSGFMMGVYADNAGVPGNLIASSGMGTIGNGINQLPISGNIYITPGDYWVMTVYEFDGNSSNIGQVSTQTLYSTPLTYGSSLPTNGAGFDSFSFAYNFSYWMELDCTPHTNSIDTVSATSLCNNSNFTVAFTATGDYYNNNFTAQISDATGDFSNPITIGTLTSNVSGTINCTIPSNLPAGTGYRIRISSDYPVAIGTDNGTDLSVNPTLTPDFTAVNPICAGDTLAALPTLSNNGITGSWLPALDNMSTTTYTFTPDSGQCATTTPMTVIVNQLPTITALANQTSVNCSTPIQLSTTNVSSINNYNITSIPYAPVTGTPNPGPSGDDNITGMIPLGFDFPFYNNTFSSVKISTNGFISFNPNAQNGCCSGQYLPNGDLSTFNNVIALSWTDLWTINGGSIEYFNLTNPNRFVVHYNNTPHFSGNTPQVDAEIILYETGEIEMHNTAIENIGTMTQGIENGDGTLATVIPGRNSTGWSSYLEAFRFTPVFSNTYAWTPTTNMSDATISNPLVSSISSDTTFNVTVTDPVGCTNSSSVSVSYIPNTVPSFDAVNPICAGTALTALPTTSNNGITGTWSPTLDNMNTTIYTFTPDAGQCADTTTLTITVNPIIAPTFNAVSPFCAGDTSLVLPLISNNGITGSWLPALDYNNSGTYTFTPDAGQCADATTLAITVNPIVTPTFDPINPICAGDTTLTLPLVSNNGITGTWSPALDNTTTTTYFFTADSGVCIATVPLTIAVNPLPAANATSTATAVACNTPFNLNTTPPSITNYTLASIPYAPVTGTPNPGPSGDDNITGMIPLGFDFPFYNNTFSSVKISTNGFISFNPNAQNGCCSGQYLPNGDLSTFNNVIALSWTDLWTYNGGSIEYFNLTNPNRFVVHYNNTPHFAGNTPQVDAEIILYETGEIEMHNTAIENIGTMTQGIENGDGSAATIVPGRNSTGWNSYLEAYRFTPVSNNATTYAWTPATNMNNAAIQNPQVSSINADTTYTVTVTDANGCVNTSSVSVAYIPNTVPSFDAVNPICAGTALTALPTTSNNGITGTWSPALDNMNTTTYTFTPDAGQCADTTTLTITVTPMVTPTFDAVNPFCTGNTSLVLPLISNNGITGSWSPALDYTTSATYTFTPDAGQCANIATLAITVNPIVTPTFDPISPICAGDTTLTLPLVSNNGITGTWSPALDNTTSGTYTFTPDAGQCAVTASLSITVNPIITPAFDAVNPICAGDALSALPTTSNNGITGSWSPALDNTSSNTYTFTPNTGQCAVTASLSITVNPMVTPTFDPINPACAGDTSWSLPTDSTNGISGYWDNPLDYNNSATYTFIPYPGQCASNTTVNVTIIPVTIPTFDAVNPICANAPLMALPTTSNNGITGTWSPALDNTTTTTYFFTADSGVCIATVPLTIAVNPLPAANATSTATAVACNTPFNLNTTPPSITNYTLTSIPYAPVTGTPNPGPSGDDNITGMIPLGFDFPFYNNTFSSVKISTNGFISFNPNAQNGCCSGQYLPNGDLSTFNNVIALSWTDLWTYNGGSIEYFNLTNPNRFVVHYNNTPHFAGNTPQVDAEIILYETGEIEMHNTAIENIGTMTQGIENGDGSAATVVPGRNSTGWNSYLEAYRFTPVSTNTTTYAWAPTTNMDNSTIQNPQVSSINADTTYTVTVTDVNGCVNTSSVTVAYIPNTVPSFDPIAPICYGDTTLVLATTSTNGITGTWSPALDYTNSATYTFTPDAGQCAEVTTLDVTVNPLTVPTFNAVAPICIGDTTLVLATTSTNGITGTWSPALDYTNSATYTFTPDAGQCSAVTTLDVTVNPLTVPSFNAVAPICIGDTSLVLATTSTNGITGTWSPALDYTNSATYTFTPDAGQCADTTTLDVTVTPLSTPTFNAVAAICAGDTSLTLATTSNNGISGTWSPAIDYSNSATYTFTPDAGQCAATTTLDVTVNPVITPTFDAVAPVCAGSTINALPTTANNGITGSWLPAIDNTTTTTYTFTPDSGVCTSTASLTITVTTTAAPTGATTQFFNETNTINDIVVNGTNIVWYPTAQDALNQTNALSTSDFLVDGLTYYATQTVDGCTSTTSLAVSITVTLGVQTFGEGHIAISPNPVSTILHITQSNHLPIDKITLYDVTGKLILSQTQNTNQLNVENFADGMYIIEATAGDQKFISKFIKK